MAKFMNAELIKIRDNLVCGHCSCVFIGSDSQAWKVKYEQKTVYCSAVCRTAATRNRLQKPIPSNICQHCNKEFFSRTSKQFCNLQCYTSSNKMKEHIKTISEKSTGFTYMSEESKNFLAEKNRARAKLSRINVNCLDCGNEINKIKSSRKKFCDVGCYRSYMAKRFDRFIANPQRMALPQCYDEFLDKEELSCPFDNCNWVGKHLSLHVNQTHGVNALDFKRAMGFNLSTGVISKDLADYLRKRALVGVAIQQDDTALEKARNKISNIVRYVSLESIEHQKKSRFVLNSEVGCLRFCIGCGVEFNQSSIFGRTLYCSKKCRSDAYNKKARKTTGERNRNSDGTFAAH
jgi:hypothetical protein